MDKEISIKRVKKSDKQKEKYARNGKYTAKATRIKQEKVIQLSKKSSKIVKN